LYWRRGKVEEEERRGEDGNVMRWCFWMTFLVGSAKGAPPLPSVKIDIQSASVCFLPVLHNHEVQQSRFPVHVLLEKPVKINNCNRESCLIKLRRGVLAWFGRTCQCSASIGVVFLQRQLMILLRIMIPPLVFIYILL